MDTRYLSDKQIFRDRQTDIPRPVENILGQTDRQADDGGENGDGERLSLVHEHCSLSPQSTPRSGPIAASLASFTLHLVFDSSFFFCLCCCCVYQKLSFVGKMKKKMESPKIATGRYRSNRRGVTDEIHIL